MSVEIRITNTYACTTDRWWTVRYLTAGGAAGSVDRMVWSPIIID